LTRRLAACCLPILLALASPAASASGDPDDTEAASSDELRLPRTIERVWYRKGSKRALGGASVSGDLTVTADALEMAGGKKTLIVPLSSIRVVSFGKMRGDVDTDWVVLAVERESGPELVGLRDGKRLGYGTRTRELYDLLIRTVRAQGAAQYDVAEGWKTYDGLDHQFTMSLPADWSSAHETVVMIDGLPVWGTTVFSRDEIPTGTKDLEGRRRAFAAVAAGETPALVLDRSEAQGGMRCAGFSKSGRARVEKRLRELEGRDEARRVELAELDLDDFSLDGCAGLRLTGRGTLPDGAEIRVEARAVAADGTLFLFLMHGDVADYESRRQAFERSVSSFRSSVARYVP
jgi:hypothetical protein